MNAARLEVLFSRCFAGDCNTLLCGGASEPLYRPPTRTSPARIDYREDFAASALHEVAHWCIAGTARRRKVDYGYWYVPDGRSADDQLAFERAEARPQALEWIFSQACGLPFTLSIDNLDGGRLQSDGECRRFAASVVRAAENYRGRGLPKRAGRFYLALLDASPQGVALADMCFSMQAPLADAV